MRYNPDTECCLGPNNVHVYWVQDVVCFAQVLFIFKLSSGLSVWVVKLLCDLCSVATYIGIK